MIDNATSFMYNQCVSVTTKHSFDSGKMPLTISKNSILERFNQVTKEKNIFSIPKPSICLFSGHNICINEKKKKSNVVNKLLEKIYLIAGSFCDFLFLFWNFSRVIVHNTKSLWFCYMLWNQLNNFQNSIPRRLIFKIPEWEKPIKTKRKQSVGFCFY